MSPRLLPVIASLTLVCGWLAVAAPAAGQDATCQGMQATLVGTPGQPLTGTDGNDVVVTNGATQTTTLSGDDVVCLSGDSTMTHSHVVDTGHGNDVVDARFAVQGVSAILGAGTDTYHGSNGVDMVIAGMLNAATGETSDLEPDVINTGAGYDSVVSGTGLAPNGDAVVIGSRGDVTWSGPMATGSHLQGGSGQTHLKMQWSASTINLDNTAGALTIDGAVALRFVGFETFDVFNTGPLKYFGFVGTGADETVILTTLGLPGSMGPRNVLMGGGDDEFSAETSFAAGSVFDGGPGKDSFTTSATSRVSYDGARQRITTVDGKATGGGRITGFETLSLRAWAVDAVGTRRPDDLSVISCVANVRSGAGGDRITKLDGSGRFRGCKPRSRLLGGPGNDLIAGSAGPDVILGGPGRDRVNGGKGRDICEGERRANCEVRRR